MNRSTELDFDQRISDWLEDDPNLAPRQAIETVLAAYPSIPQRRPMGLPRRLTTMTMPIRLATAAVVGVLAVGGAYYLSRPAQPAVGPPAPTSSASPSPAPTPQVSATSDAAEAGRAAPTTRSPVPMPQAATRRSLAALSTRLRTRSASRSVSGRLAGHQDQVPAPGCIRCRWSPVGRSISAPPHRACTRWLHVDTPR